MKNFNNFWSSLRGVMKKQYRRGLPKKGEHGQFIDLRGVLGKNSRVGTVFEG